MKTFVIVTLIVAGLLMVGVAVAKKQGFCDAEGRADWMVDRISQRLELDADQQSKLEQLRDRLMVLREQFHEARSESRDTVSELLAAPTLDQDRVQALFDQRHSAMADNSGDIIAAIAEFSDSLNDEQRDTVREWMERRMEHRGHYGFGHRHWRM